MRRRHVEKDVGHDCHVWRKPHVVVNNRGNKVSGFDWLNWYQMKEEEFLYPFFSQSSIGTRNRIYGSFFKLEINIMTVKTNILWVISISIER